jgi:hypothetical protein
MSDVIKNFLKNKKILLDELLSENENLRNQIEFELSPLSFGDIEKKKDFKEKVKQAIKLLNERIRVVTNENTRIQHLKELLEKNKELRQDKSKKPFTKKLEPLNFTTDLKHNISILEKENEKISKYTDFIVKNIEAVKKKQFI